MTNDAKIAVKNAPSATVETIFPTDKAPWTTVQAPLSRDIAPLSRDFAPLAVGKALFPIGKIVGTVVAGALLPRKGVVTILPGAMTADDATVAPTKRGRRAWLIAVAVVVAVVTIVLLANAPKSEPVKVWFVRETNEMGQKRLVFEGTNGMMRKVGISACVFAGPMHEQTTGKSPVSRYDSTNATVSACVSFFFTLKAPPKDLSYVVRLMFLDVDYSSSGLEMFRWRCYSFFAEHNMPRVADHFAPMDTVHYIPSTEIKE